MTASNSATSGFGSTRTHTTREVLAALDQALHLPGGKILDGSKSRDTANTGDVDVLRPGVLLGKISASGKYAPSILGTLSVAHTSDVATSMTLTAAAATELARRVGTSGTFKLTGPPTAAGTVATATVTYSAVDTTTGVVTISVVTTDFVAGSLVQPTDGSETPLALLDGFVKATDEDGASQDCRLPRLLIAGMIDADMIVHYPGDSSLKTWVKSQLNAVGRFVFDDVF
jgi:hypothetical protein